MAASELESNISYANFSKNKKKLFLYFDNSHANQTNTTKKDMIFFHILLTLTKIYRRMKRNVVLNASDRAGYLDQTQAIMS